MEINCSRYGTRLTSAILPGVGGEADKEVVSRMIDANWPADHLRQLLISQQEEYHRRGLEHELYVETDETFYSKLLYHRLIVLSLIPEECRRPRTKVVDVGGGKGRISTMLTRPSTTLCKSAQLAPVT